jgi:anoctamin-8
LISSLAATLLRRRDVSTGQYATLKRLTLNETPSQCDVVLEFTGKALNRRHVTRKLICSFIEEKAPDDALMWLMSRIKSHQPEGKDLYCSAIVHESAKCTAFYVSAPVNVLCKAAEEHRLAKRLKPELGGAFRDFTIRESHCFKQIKDGEGKLSLFTSQERQWLVLQVLQSIRASSTDVSNFQGRANVEEGQSVISAWQDSGVIKQIFPLHDPHALKSLQAKWLSKFFAPHPIGKPRLS